MEQSNKDLLVAIPFMIVFIIIGAALVYWGYYIYHDIQSVRKHGIKTEGIILRYERRGTETINMKDMSAVPIIQYQTEEGQSIVVEGKVDNISVLQNICEGGERVEIIYDPKNPKHAVINTFAEFWFLPLLLWTIGIGFIVVPPYTISSYYKKKHRRKNGAER